MKQIEINAQFAQVLEFINKTSRNVFLTGKAGTGKTTLLKHIRENTYKQIAVCAPTGVAAINAGGSTLHSFFQFPFTPFIPHVKQNGDIDASSANLPSLKYNSQRLSIFRSLELLVIDEISMVRADMLDQIDITLRYTRRRWNVPFGGVQLLLIGDMHQLAPVAQAEEWRILQAHYRSPYFFDSYVIKKHPPVYIELTKVYRQSDQVFIDLLNKLRHDALDEDAQRLLNTRYRSRISQEEYVQSITLTTHNRKADAINSENLQALPGKLHRFDATVKGVFPEKNFPAAIKLELKVGARVMTLKNNPDKNYYNGKTGVVTSVSEDKVRVKCDDDRTEIVVERENWDNISYKVDKASRHINEEILGTFTQFPLRHAWAITIHKSQGLTFDKVIIDAAEAFSAGQVYVALSRCRSLEGLTLSTRIAEHALKNDEQVLSFASARPGESELTSILQQSRSAYVRSLLYSVFDFSELAELRKELASLQQLHDRHIGSAGKDWLREFFEVFDGLHQVEIKFREQLRAIAEQSPEPESNAVLQDRVQKASAYFSKEAGRLHLSLKNCRLSTENREAGNDFNQVLQGFSEGLHSKSELLKACEAGFNFDGFLKARLNVVYPSKKINIYGGAPAESGSGILHSALYTELLLLRNEICQQEGKPIYLVANANTIAELAKRLPTSPEQLLQIKGFGKAKVNAYGNVFLDAIRGYCAENMIVSQFDLYPETIKPKSKKRSDSGDTRKQTMQMFRDGMSPEQIAKERGLTVGTVLSHLIRSVSSGEIGLDLLVSEEKQALIHEAIKGSGDGEGLGAVKSRLPDEISYDEIKLVKARLEYLAASDMVH